MLAVRGIGTDPMSTIRSLFELTTVGGCVLKMKSDACVTMCVADEIGYLRLGRSQFIGDHSVLM